MLRQLQSRSAARRFHQVWYDRRLWTDVSWRGVQLLKNPMDLWTYQEVIHETRPDLVIETGTHSGGSALYFADLLDLCGGGQVVTVDVEPLPDRPAHPRVTYLDGSSTDPEIVARMCEAAAGASRVMVVLDSDHTAAHVAEELEAYGPLVTPGCYLVVEDSNVNGHPVRRSFGPGPMEAARRFLADHPEFEVDARRERFLFTFNPSGWLVRR